MARMRLPSMPGRLPSSQATVSAAPEEMPAGRPSIRATLRAMAKALALETVPSSVTLLIGLPAYHTDEPGHTDAETVAAAVRGVRLAVDGGIDRPFGVALYADFSATPADWDAYQTGWVRPG